MKHTGERHYEFGIEIFQDRLQELLYCYSFSEEIYQ
jgi:hypothetical protein